MTNLNSHAITVNVKVLFNVVAGLDKD